LPRADFPFWPLIALAVYFWPTIRAYNLRAPNVAGVAYAWAPKAAPPAAPASFEPEEPDGLPCPRCAEAILPRARVRRFCGHALAPGWAAGAKVVMLRRTDGREL
jgi:hypothetical protein